MKYEDAMVDIETLDVVDSAVVLTIGVQLFDLAGQGYDEDDGFAITLDFQDQLNRGRTVSASTISWWMTQGNAARSQTFTKGRLPVEDGLNYLSTVLVDYDIQRLWGNGAGFDLNIIRSLYRSYDQEFPLSHRVDMDLRTLRMLAGNPAYPGKIGVAHEALDDARYQVLCAQLYWRKINGEAA